MFRRFAALPKNACRSNLMLTKLSKPVVVKACFSDSTSKPPVSKEIPLNFYDDEIEKEKEFLDVIGVMKNENGDLETITLVKEPGSWKEIEENSFQPLPPISVKEMWDNFDEDDGLVVEVDEEGNDVVEDDGTEESALITDNVRQLFAEDLAEHLDPLDNQAFVPLQMLDMTQDWRMTQEHPVSEELDNFVPTSSKEKYRYDQQGLRTCEGKKQRKGLYDKLGCHLVDLDKVEALDILTLRRFLTEDSEIMGRRETGLCARCQRKVAKTIKRSRQMGFLPHIGEYVIKDSRPLHRGNNYHDIVTGSEYLRSKTIM